MLECVTDGRGPAENWKMLPTQMNLIAFANSIKTSLDRKQNARGFDMIKNIKYLLVYSCHICAVDCEQFYRRSTTFPPRGNVDKQREQQILGANSLLSKYDCDNYYQ